MNTFRIIFCSLLSLYSTHEGVAQLFKKSDVANVFRIAERQYAKQDSLHLTTECYPRTLNRKGELVSTRLNDWTEGFFPGAMWYIYENNHSPEWKDRALKWTLPMEKLKDLTSHHDIGFLMYCSFGNAFRLTNDKPYEATLITAAKSLCSRFSERTGTIKSWDYRESWDGQKWYYPVIIDNMMNLELLYFASKVTGDQTYAQIATKHAETTAQYHFRDDYSSYHVVNYSPATGEVLFRGTCQGFSDQSTWSRGQAWAIYGYTMTYRFTKNKKFLRLAQKLADYWINHPNMPYDRIPYWDFNAGQPGFPPADWAKKRPVPDVQPRDASAAAITCSALLELSCYLKEGRKYRREAEKILVSLSSPAYLAQAGNGQFILRQSVGALPFGAEINVPLVYADYYFLEALLRYKKLL